MRARTILGAIALIAITAAMAHAQNPRFGVWQLKSDNPPPYKNIMTYEPHGDGGMKVTVEATSSKGEVRKWSYVTMFDGKYRPVTGDTRTEESAVEVVDERTNKIMNRSGDRVNIIINVLSEDGNTIENEYRSIGDDGEERISHATYVRIR